MDLLPAHTTSQSGGQTCRRANSCFERTFARGCGPGASSLCSNGFGGVAPALSADVAIYKDGERPGCPPNRGANSCRLEGLPVAICKSQKSQIFPGSGTIRS